MRAGLIAVIVVIVVGVIIALNSFFIVNPAQQALVLQFGEVRQAQRDPGLSFKIPVIQDVLFLDKRVLDLNVPAQEIIAEDQKRLVVDAFMRYRITNPVRFYQTVNNVREGATRLSTFAQSSLRAVLADATFQDIVRDDRPELMRRISQDVAARARDIGVEVVDVKIRRADLPEANSEAIFARMQTEREQEAAQIRAQGREAAQRVQAAADRTATVLRAEAQREAEQIRGQGDGQKNAIFAQAYSSDPQFFAFYRAMQAYEDALSSEDTRLVLSPDADFFRYFNDPLGEMRSVGNRGEGARPPGQTDGVTPTPGPVSTGPATAEEQEAAAAQAAASDPATAVDRAQQALTRAQASGRRTLDEPSSPQAAMELIETGTTAALDAQSEAVVPTEEGPQAATEAASETTPADESTDAAIEAADPAPSPAANEAAEADVSAEGAADADVSAEDAPAPIDASFQETERGTVTIVRPDAAGE